MNLFVCPSIRLSSHGQLAKIIIALKSLGIFYFLFWYTDRYRQSLVNPLAKCHFPLTDATPKQKYKTMEIAVGFQPYGIFSLTIWHILITFCIHIKIDKIKTKESPNVTLS